MWRSFVVNQTSFPNSGHHTSVAKNCGVNWGNKNVWCGEWWKEVWCELDERKKCGVHHTALFPQFSTPYFFWKEVVVKRGVGKRSVMWIGGRLSSVGHRIHGYSGPSRSHTSDCVQTIETDTSGTKMFTCDSDKQPGRFWPASQRHSWNFATRWGSIGCNIRICLACPKKQFSDKTTFFFFRIAYSNFEMSFQVAMLFKSYENTVSHWWLLAVCLYQIAQLCVALTIKYLAIY